MFECRAVGAPMKLSAGARQLALQHVSIRVPWHDNGWTGSACRKPIENTACLVLKNIGEKRDDTKESACAGKRLDQLTQAEWPPCVEERATFMAPFALTREIRHPYTSASKGTHGHLLPTPYPMPAYSAAAIPFKWLRRDEVEGLDGAPGIAEKLQLGFEREREPILDFNKGKGEDGGDKDGGWLNDKHNQLAVTDTFFSAVEPEQSLCFFYAKRTPLAPEDGRRVIVGVGLVTALGDPVEYKSTDKTKLRSVTFERNILHSIRPDFRNGFVLPYREILDLAQNDPSIDPSEHVAFVADQDREDFSYVTEHVTHDAAIAALLSCSAVLHRLGDVVAGPWDQCISWVDRQLNRLWKMRGPCPGMGSALSALGVQNGTLIAQDIAATQARANRWNEDPWLEFEAALKDPRKLSPGLAPFIGADIKKLYTKLPAERKSLLKLLSRFAISAEQATRFYQETERENVGVATTDAELLANPYLLYELDRTAREPISLTEIDRGMFPDPVVAEKHPLPEPSALKGALDDRRVRGFVVDALEQAALEGHTLAFRHQVIKNVRARGVKPELPLSADVLAANELDFEPFVTTLVVNKEPAFQLDRFVSGRDLIRKEVEKRRKAKRHVSKADWAKLIDAQFKDFQGAVDKDEKRARAEKTAALEELFSARLSVLLGPAGTGKTTLLRALCEMPEVSAGGLLLLAPTGKARVRLEAQTRVAGAKTVAQFLMKLRRYDGATGRYFMNPEAARHNQHKTVIVDECSMLTEEQLAAVVDALAGVERLILVGDPRQLPPIGSGRPFVDLVSHLTPDDLEGRFPKVAPSYAELTVSRRQQGSERRDDVTLAHWFSGRPLDPGADEIWDRATNLSTTSLRLVRWDTTTELEERLLATLVEELKLASRDDQNGFEQTLGATLYEKNNVTYFSAGTGDRVGAAAKAETWQVLSPVRAGLPGVDRVNRMIQEVFRSRTREWADAEFFRRKIPPPMGPQGLLYGDKVISIVNGARRYCWPKPEENPYVANGDVGILTGDYKSYGKQFIPKNLVVEFVTHQGIGIKYFPSEFGDEKVPPLELAYALTVHKTQGSEFGLTFVILPNPCRVLSRELLYTALTRQKDKIILLHQGEARDLLKFADASESETARRCTNLFADPNLIEVEKRFLEERLIHRTARGDRVRSKSEVILADKLHERGIDYQYEQPFVAADGDHRLPDFTIDDAASGLKIIWEHLGMLTVPEYRDRWERKRKWYEERGVLPGPDGGPNGRLVVSEDLPNGGIDSKALDDQIRDVFDL